MKRISKLLLLPAVMLCGGAMAQSDAGSSTHLLTQQQNIKAYVHFSQNIGTGTTAMLEFYNSGKQNAVVKWSVKDSEGRVVCSGTTQQIAPGKMLPVYANSKQSPLAEELSEALNNASNTVVINSIN